MKPDGASLALTCAQKQQGRSSLALTCVQKQQGGAGVLLEGKQPDAVGGEAEAAAPNRAMMEYGGGARMHIGNLIPTECGPGAGNHSRGLFQSKWPLPVTFPHPLPVLEMLHCSAGEAQGKLKRRETSARAMKRKASGFL